MNLIRLVWNGNTLDSKYPLDNAVSYSSPIEGSQVVRIQNGDEYAWIPNVNYVLEGDVRWLSTTDWDDANGWRAFLEYARQKNKFQFYPNKNLGTYIDSYLVEPMGGEHTLEPDGTRKVRLVIRNTTTAYAGY